MMKRFLLIIITLCSMMTAHAQCGIENTAFKSGEYLSYDLYFNWKFVWMKVGTASMSTIQSTRDGKPAYRSSLITRGNNKLDHYFVMRDTLLCYTGLDIAPLYFRKGAREGDRYYVDELWYTYPNGNCHLRMHRIDADGGQFLQHHRAVQRFAGRTAVLAAFIQEGHDHGDAVGLARTGRDHAF